VAADDQGRWSMNGVEVTDPGDGTFCCVGTDGRYLLVVRGIQAGDGKGHLGCPPDRAVLVPAVAWTEAFRKMPKLLDQPHWSKKPATVEVALEGQKVRLSGHERNFTCDQVDGRFPDWRQVLPKKPPAFSIYVDPERLADLLKTVQGMIGESHKVTLAFWKDSEPLAIVAREPETGLCLDGIIMPLTPSPSEVAKDKAKRAAEQEEEEEDEIVVRCEGCDFKGFEREFADDKCPKCGSDSLEEYEGSPALEETASGTHD
jgi:hypothetical protein